MPITQDSLIADALARFGLPLGDVIAWIMREARIGPPTSAQILNDKGWSIVIHFGSVVLKVTAATAFPSGPQMFELVGKAAPDLVPELLACQVSDDGVRSMLFRPFAGIPIADLPANERSQPLVMMAQSIARIQAQVKPPVSAVLPRVYAGDLPGMLDEMLQDVVPYCRGEHQRQWATECAKQEVPDHFTDALQDWRGNVEEWAAELKEWDGSIDHVDLLPHNANFLSADHCVIYDWEQATLGIPFFSLDILLAYAQSIDECHEHLVLLPERSTATQDRMLQAYERERPGPLKTSLLLSPIRYGLLEWRQAKDAGVPHFGVDDVVWWLSRGLRRWLS